MLDHFNSKEERHRQYYCQSLHSSSLKELEASPKVRKMGGKGREGGREEERRKEKGKGLTKYLPNDQNRVVFVFQDFKDYLPHSSPAPHQLL